MKKQLFLSFSFLRSFFEILIHQSAHSIFSNRDATLHSNQQRLHSNCRYKLLDSLCHYSSSPRKHGSLRKVKLTEAPALYHGFDYNIEDAESPYLQNTQQKINSSHLRESTNFSFEVIRYQFVCREKTEKIASDGAGVFKSSKRWAGKKHWEFDCWNLFRYNNYLYQSLICSA